MRAHKNVYIEHQYGIAKYKDLLASIENTKKHIKECILREEEARDAYLEAQYKYVYVQKELEDLFEYLERREAMLLEMETTDAE